MLPLLYGSSTGIFFLLIYHVIFLKNIPSDFDWLLPIAIVRLLILQSIDIFMAYFIPNDADHYNSNYYTMLSYM